MFKKSNMEGGRGVALQNHSVLTINGTLHIELLNAEWLATTKQVQIVVSQ